MKSIACIMSSCLSENCSPSMITSQAFSQLPTVPVAHLALSVRVLAQRQERWAVKLYPAARWRPHKNKKTDEIHQLNLAYTHKKLTWIYIYIYENLFEKEKASSKPSFLGSMYIVLRGIYIYKPNCGEIPLLN